MNIDFGKAVTAEAKVETAAVAVLDARKAECKARIFAVADEMAQINLAAAAAAGLLNADDLATYQAGLGWVASMRVACATGDDWPAVPAGVVELAARF